MTSCILHTRSFFAVFWSAFLKTLNKKAITILKTDAFQKTGDKFPNIKVTTSLRLISMGTVTAQKNRTFSHAWEPRFVHSFL